MKKLLSIVLAFGIFLIAAGVVVASLLWKGVDWGTYGGAFLGVNSSGSLEVSAGDNYAAAHYNTPQAFRASPSECIELKFQDKGTNGPRTQMWVEKEGGPNAAWFQVGTWEGNNQYRVYWWNVDADTEGWEDLGDRSEGIHTIKIGKRLNGVIDFILDGKVAWSTTNIAPSYFGDVYLASRYGVSEFTDYSTCTNYQYPVSGVITNPQNDGDHVSKTLNLRAVYDDGDTVNDDVIQWALRKGTCNAGQGTVLGNVDGHNDVANWDGGNFSFDADIRDANAFVPGEYCFVFNPADDPGEPDIRLTRTFYIDAYTPVLKEECKDGGWESYVTPPFKNQGDCVSYVESNKNALGNKNK